MLSSSSGERNPCVLRGGSNHLLRASTVLTLVALVACGGDELTSFNAVGDRSRTCQDFTSPGCTMGGLQVDVITGSPVFSSSCDPLGKNRTGGGQVFAIDPDGRGLRQLTETEGIIENPDRSIDVELPGPFSISSEPR